MIVGWQLIHAYLASEGVARKWASNNFAGKQDFTGWREGMSLPEEEDDDIDNLAI